MSSTAMDAHEKWCRSVIDSLDLEVNHIIMAFGLPSPIIVSWAHRSLWKPISSSTTPMIPRVSREERESCGDDLKSLPETCDGDDFKNPPDTCDDDDLKNPPETCDGDDLKKPRGFWRRTKKRLSDIFLAVCTCGCATRHTQ